MKKLKVLILFIILAITVGIAAVSSNLLINGSTSIASNPDDFLVYFSDVLVDGTQDLSLVQSETSLSFNAEFSAVGDKKEIIYDITNASKNYDADIDITCTQSTEYLSIINDFDTSSNLVATSTRTGVLTVALSKSYIGSDLKQDISCTISASAVERSSQGSGSVAGAVDPYYIGKEILIGKDKFNVISSDATTVTLLAKYGISNGDRQSIVDSLAVSMVGSGDECLIADGITDINIQSYHGDASTLLNNYVDNLKELIGDDGITGNLLSLSQLGELGCTVPDNYNFGNGGWTCSSSPYFSWLAISSGEYPFFLLSSVVLDDAYKNIGSIWTINANGILSYYSTCGADGSLRPTITMRREILEKFNYDIGDEVVIGTEKFNVISDNGNTVSLLAQYNISEMDYWQSEDEWPLFYDSQIEDGSERYVADYASILSSYLGVPVLNEKMISVNDLVNFGCFVPDTTSYNGVENCDDSPYKDWLINGQNWWTSSTIYDTKQWGVLGSGDLFEAEIYESKLGARPVINIPKEVLEKNVISFTISGDIYFAENDMTWGEWVVSKYNVPDNIKSLDGFIFIDEFILKDSDSFFVHVGDSVLANYSYMSSGVGHS